MNSNNTPLHLAAFHGNLNIVKLLLRTPGIDLNPENIFKLNIKIMFLKKSIQKVHTRLLIQFLLNSIFLSKCPSYCRTKAKFRVD